MFLPDENTIKTNVLIAEFMGLHKYSEFQYNHNGMICMDGELAYHRSYDWLMEVKEKIESMKNEFENFSTWNEEPFSVQIELSYCHIAVDNDADSLKFKTKPMFGRYSELTLKDAMYVAFIEFITWYNQQIKK